MKARQSAEKMVEDFRRYHAEGFTRKELIQICDINKINYNKFAEAFGIRTGIEIGGHFLFYTDDV